MDRLVLTTVPGLELVAAAEARDGGLPATPAGQGLLEARVDPASLAPTVRRLNRRLRCFRRIGVRVGRGEAGSLEGAAAWARSLPWERFFTSPASYAVRVERRGGHPFRSPDLEREIGGAVQDRFRDQGIPPPAADLTDPDALLRVDLDDERIVAWLDTTGYRGLHVRDYRRYAHMASMRPTMANLLLRLAGWRGEGTLIDPFCGSATIPIEAALIARGVPAGASRGEPWVWERIPWLVQGRELGDDRTRDPAPRRPLIVGVERYSGHLQGAAENAAAAGVIDDLRLIGGRAQSTDRVMAGLRERAGAPGPRMVVTNPPFGRRVGFTSETANLYRDAAASWARAGVERVATLAERGDVMQGALDDAGFAIRERLQASYGALRVSVMVADRR